MPTKIRLQRRGKKGRPFFHIVIADSRAPRDGKFVEKIGTYNPLTIPASIELDFDRALYWYQTGAQPTETVRAILSYKGILFKSHLLNGVKKGALTTEQVEEKFQQWLTQKNLQISEKTTANKRNYLDDKKKRLENEIKIKEERAEAIAKRKIKENLKLEEAEAAEEQAPQDISNETAEPQTEAPAESTEPTPEV
jgi:small subunit ribosomal protein S16